MSNYGYWDEVCHVLNEAEAGRNTTAPGQRLPVTVLCAVDLIMDGSPDEPDPELSPEEMASALVGLADRDPPLVDESICATHARALWGEVASASGVLS